MPKGYVNIESGIQRTPEGNYWVRASVRHPRTGKLLSRSATLPTGACLIDARKRLAALRVEVEEMAAGSVAVVRPRGRVTVKRAAEGWIEGHYDRNRGSTADQYRHVIKQHVLPAPVAVAAHAD